MRSRLRIVSVVALLVLGIAGVLSASLPPAEDYEREIFYYSGPDMEEIVGYERTFCDRLGIGWGMASPYSSEQVTPCPIWLSE
jgi:hypothetical protein